MVASLDQLQREELRAFCDCPPRFQVLDFLGTALGSYFALDGLRRINKPGERPWATTSIALGSLMIWIHSRRFVHGSELGTRWEAPSGMSGIGRCNSCGSLVEIG